MGFDYKTWNEQLEQLIGKPVMNLGAEEFKTFVCCFPLKTAREYFDWTGATPIVDHFCVVVGRIPAGEAAPDFFEYIEELNVYYAPKPGKKFVNQYKKYHADDDDEDKKN